MVKTSKVCSTDCKGDTYEIDPSTHIYMYESDHCSSLHVSLIAAVHKLDRVVHCVASVSISSQEVELCSTIRNHIK
jgi:hypothetical protein